MYGCNVIVAARQPGRHRIRTAVWLDLYVCSTAQRDDLRQWVAAEKPYDSLGEQQRMGVARMFWHEPRIGILDECAYTVTYYARVDHSMHIGHRMQIYINAACPSLSGPHTMPRCHG